MLKKIALLLLLIAPMSVFAQKFGHVKFAEILTVMPEYTKAQTDIQAQQRIAGTERKRYAVSGRRSTAVAEGIRRNDGTYL